MIQWEMIRWAVQSGFSVYDFQGAFRAILSTSTTPIYGLYQFKRGFFPASHARHWRREFHWSTVLLASGMVELAASLQRKAAQRRAAQQTP
jgi:lipid II:glycine glycyltransferase (peptidoglycan interpeptide bridge formation enzyme)